MSKMQVARRSWLVQASALVTSVTFPRFIPLAGAESPSTINALPRIALVIGNAGYADAPLRNPSNDAKAFSGNLQKLGFQVAVKLDAGRTSMIDSIGLFTSQLARQKAVGLFYFAGHGAQLSWRNYLLPVDARMEQLDDIRTQAIALTALLDGLVKAQNPMNLIILDACRDNPFGSIAAPQQKGLSQFDAPSGSLLAYATAPGNTAADGIGANGLYTENLLREMQVPDTKIEDVFKRVRQKVRRESKGQQIPWESTSLEEDFYFLPPANVKKLSEAELEKQFNEELALWERARTAQMPSPLEDYLRTYPSGHFSELAQLQLDRVLARNGEKRVEAVAVAANPFSKGTSLADPNFKIGDSYTYRILDVFSKVENARSIETVTDVTEGEIIFNHGQLILDSLGNEVLDRHGRRFSPSQLFVTEYSVGKNWRTRFRLTRINRTQDEVEVNLRVVAREFISVPAGTFDAFKVEGQGTVRNSGAVWSYVYWIEPGKIRRIVAMEYINRNRRGRIDMGERYELVAFTQQE